MRRVSRKLTAPGLRSVGLGMLISLCASQSYAACYSQQTQLPAATVSKFVGDPSASLNQAPQGGGQFLNQVRDLAASNPDTLPLISGLVSKANKDQKFAIGSGLAQAAIICAKTDQPYAAKIQQAILDTKDQELIVAFAAISGDRATTAVGGAGAGAPGGASGGPVSTTTSGFRFGGNVEAIGGGSVATGVFGYTAGVSGTQTTNNNTNNNAGATVSP